MIPAWQALRARHWVKNLLVFVPLITGHRLGDTPLLGLAALAFVGFCLAASGGYLLNDLLDLDHDRRHPWKRNRPLATGSLSVAHAWALAALLVVGATALGWWTLSRMFVASLVCYVALSATYSLYLKGIVVLDVLVLAALYCVRIVAGGIATATFVSPWLLAFSLFLFLSLALLKRYIELRRASPDRAEAWRPGRGYVPEDLDLLRSVGPVTGYLSVLVLALYINSETASALYQSPVWLWLIVPLLLYWITRIWLLANRGGITEDPVVFATADGVTYLIGALVAAVLALNATAPTL